MEDKVLIAPINEEKKLYDPYRKDFVPSSGRKVALDQYWQRRIVEGVAIIVTENLNKENDSQ